MVDGQEGTEKVIAAELMPVATAEKKGVMSAAMSQKVLPLIQIMLTDTQSIIKITLSGKYVALCGCIGNYNYERLFLISSSGRVAEGQHKLPNIKIIYKNGNLKFYTAANKEFVDVYISGIGFWGEFSALSFTGQVNSVSIVSEMPSTVTEITPIE